MFRKYLIFLSVLYCFVISVTALAKQIAVVGQVEVTDNGHKALVKFEAEPGSKKLSVDGFFRRSSTDGSGLTYVKLSYLKVDDGYAWFAGRCTQDEGDLTGRWLFATAHDGGKPGRLLDHLWWEWLPDTNDAEAKARSKVENLEKPAYNKSIESGEITVRTGG